jgi:hypothetical protein
MDFIYKVPSQGTRWRHKKRGTTYTEVCRAQLQAMEPAPEGHVLIVYRSDDDGRYWARPAGEFLDGRFEGCPAQELKPKSLLRPATTPPPHDPARLLTVNKPRADRDDPDEFGQ